ncbi:MAG: 6-carboxytetrahydropterin synthase [Aquificae bacterium]|nr:6-carboxytetrahydropterin synthase [Aquificota bacterium]
MPWRVRVIKSFEAAHFLTRYKGKPEPVHGHSWKVELFVECKELKDDLCVDFLELDRLLGELLPNYCLLNERFNFSPSAENLARWLYHEVKKRYPGLVKVVVWETERFGAEYYE